MAYILREYKCSVCGHVWETLADPMACPKHDEHTDKTVPYGISKVIGKPASYKHSSWESWRKR